MGLMKPRVSSYVDRGNELIAKGKTKQAMNLVSHGLQYYSERVIDSMTWKEPPYELFDPETGHQQFYDLCMDAKALVICYQEKRAGEAVGYTIYARSGTRADLNAYITTNREEEATALANGKKIKRPAESKLQPLDCSMLPRDYVIQEDSKQLCLNRYQERVRNGEIPSWIDPEKFKILERTVVEIASDWKEARDE